MPRDPRMFTHQTKDGHPPARSVPQTWNLALRLNSQKLHWVTTDMDSHLPSLGGSPTKPRMVTHQQEVYHRHGIRHLNFTHKINTAVITAMDGLLPFPGWSPTNQNMNTHQTPELALRIQQFKMDLNCQKLAWAVGWRSGGWLATTIVDRYFHHSFLIFFFFSSFPSQSFLIEWLLASKKTI